MSWSKNGCISVAVDLYNITDLLKSCCNSSFTRSVKKTETLRYVYQVIKHEHLMYFKLLEIDTCNFISTFVTNQFAVGLTTQIQFSSGLQRLIPGLFHLKLSWENYWCKIHIYKVPAHVHLQGSGIQDLLHRLLPSETVFRHELNPMLR